MNTYPPNARHAPQLSINPDEIMSRLRDLAASAICERCQEPASNAIAEIAYLTIIVRLYAVLRKERLRSANLEAAIRAALGAASDGEPDPLAYLRDELPDYPGGAHGA